MQLLETNVSGKTDRHIKYCFRCEEKRNAYLHRHQDAKTTKGKTQGNGIHSVCSGLAIFLNFSTEGCTKGKGAQNAPQSTYSSYQFLLFHYTTHYWISRKRHARQSIRPTVAPGLTDTDKKVRPTVSAGDMLRDYQNFYC